MIKMKMIMNGRWKLSDYAVVKRIPNRQCRLGLIPVSGLEANPNENSKSKPLKEFSVVNDAGRNEYKVQRLCVFVYLSILSNWNDGNFKVVLCCGRVVVVRTLQDGHRLLSLPSTGDTTNKMMC
jgi:hypothetical protein